MPLLLCFRVVRLSVCTSRSLIALSQEPESMNRVDFGVKGHRARYASVLVCIIALWRRHHFRLHAVEDPSSLIADFILSYFSYHSAVKVK